MPLRTSVAGGLTWAAAACLADEVRGGEDALGAPEWVVEVGAVGLELRGQPAVQHQPPAAGLHPPLHRRARGPLLRAVAASALHHHPPPAAAAATGLDVLAVLGLEGRTGLLF